MRPPWLRGFDYVGFYRYLLTFCTKDRLARFAAAGVVLPVMTHIRQCAAAERFAITAYCAMPDHVHLLVDAQSATSQLLRFVVTAKQRTGYWHSQRTGEELWQRGFYDHVLWEDEDDFPFLVYVLANPIRKGLTRALGEYRFAAAETFTIEQIFEEMRQRGWSTDLVPASLARRLSRPRRG